MAKLPKIATDLRAVAMKYPGAWEDTPWGDCVVKVGSKIFLFCGVNEKKLYLSVKLPASGLAALQLPFAKPTAYGLGKSGWVSAQFAEKDEVPTWLLADWIDESYRAIAPPKLAARIGTGGPALAAPAPAPAAKASPRTRPARRPSASSRSRSRQRAKR